MKIIKRLLILCIIIGILVAGGSMFSSDEKPMTYRTAPVTRGNIREVVSATGNIIPDQLVDVGTQVSGQIKGVYVKVNDEVKKGQLLAEVDPSLLEAQVRQSKSGVETARINYEQAQRDLKRAQMLFDKDYVAKVDVEHAQQAALQARNSYESAKIQLERDKVNLGYTQITSPINGIIISQEVNSGQTVAATYQTPNMFKIAGDLTKMKINVNLSESDIGKVRVGMDARFTVDAFPGKEFTGRVESTNLNPNSTQGVVTYTVGVSVPNPDKSLLPGMTAYVSITLSEKKDILRVPSAALRFTPPQQQVNGVKRLLTMGSSPLSKPKTSIGADGKRTIYLLKNGQPVPVSVTTGAEDESNTEVSGEELHEGDEAITGISYARR